MSSISKIADKYINSLYNESFDNIGEVTPCVIGNICGLLEEENNDTINDLRKGTLITKNNRTLIDAIYENKNASFAEAYLLRGVYSPKLILTIILSDTDEYVAYFDSGGLAEEDYESRVRELYDFIETEYNTVEDKEEYIHKIWNNFNRIQLSKEYKKVNNQDNYAWIRKLKYEMKKTKEE